MVCAHDQSSARLVLTGAVGVGNSLPSRYKNRSPKCPEVKLVSEPSEQLGNVNKGSLSSARPGRQGEKTATTKHYGTALIGRAKRYFLKVKSGINPPLSQV